MPVVIGDYFEDEIAARSVEMVDPERVDKLLNITVAKAVPAVNVESLLHYLLQKASDLSILVGLNYMTSQMLFKIWTLATIAIFSVSLLNLAGGPEMHSVSIAKQPFVKLEKEGGTSRIIRLCVDSGATSGCISKARIDKARMKTVSYTHLTLPTIYSV